MTVKFLHDLSQEYASGGQLSLLQDHPKHELSADIAKQYGHAFQLHYHLHRQLGLLLIEQVVFDDIEPIVVQAAYGGVEVAILNVMADEVVSVSTWVL